MNYQLRNLLLKRWALVTFAVSLFVSAGSFFFQSWEFLLPKQTLSFVPPDLLNFLLWPTINVLFVVSYAYLDTSALILKYFWQGSQGKKYLLVSLKALLISVFSLAYNQLFLIVAVILMKTLISEYFSSSLFVAREKYLRQAECLQNQKRTPWYYPSYDMLFFYIIIALSTWIGPPASFWGLSDAAMNTFGRLLTALLILPFFYLLVLLAFFISILIIAQSIDLVMRLLRKDAVVWLFRKIRPVQKQPKVMGKFQRTVTYLLDLIIYPVLTGYVVCKEWLFPTAHY